MYKTLEVDLEFEQRKLLALSMVKNYSGASLSLLDNLEITDDRELADLLLKVMLNEALLFAVMRILNK